jgi:hemolysin D
MAFGALSRHWTVWKAAWQAEAGKGSGTLGVGCLTPSGKDSRPRETEFLPAVLEIQQAPPSPIGRAILWTIMMVFASAVL